MQKWCKLIRIPKWKTPPMGNCPSVPSARRRSLWPRQGSPESSSGTQIVSSAVSFTFQGLNVKRWPTWINLTIISSSFYLQRTVARPWTPWTVRSTTRNCTAGSVTHVVTAWRATVMDTPDWPRTRPLNCTRRRWSQRAYRSLPSLRNRLPLVLHWTLVIRSALSILDMSWVVSWAKAKVPSDFSINREWLWYSWSLAWWLHLATDIIVYLYVAVTTA